MNKIQATIWINATKIDMENNKIVCKDGTFYFNGKLYTIKDGNIVYGNYEGEK